ncbi:MAG TPA: GMP/IMP nucleotidase [Steroidobacteraceae bacterium]|jgi:putative hydrolase of the HAD superfamily|nr:GMP/IMP nucleotidase [Steroidobacteraceae bacterium]
MSASSSAVDWETVDTVLLDMDGTLLDLRFDNWFWGDLVPSRYAAANDISEARAHELLAVKFGNVAHTLQWYCIEYWSRELKLDIPALKRETLPRVGFLPGAEMFLRKLRASGKRLVLVTNSHPTTLAIKNERVALTQYFHACYSSQPFDAPKEHAAFWPRLAAREEFSAQRTLFIDDSLRVLQCARDYGIAHLRAVRRPDSGAPPQATADFAAIDGVAELVGNLA